MKKIAIILAVVAALCSLSMADSSPAGNRLSNVQSGTIIERGDHTRALDDTCTITCPEGGVYEDEGQCQRGANEGCNSVPPSQSPIECGMTVCGTLSALDGTRDTDFYHLVLTTQTQVTWRVLAQVPISIAIAGVGADCGTLPIYDFQQGPECQVLTASACLDSGEYWLFVASQAFGDIECANYIAHVSCQPCCDATPAVVFTTPPPVFQCAHLCAGVTTLIGVCIPGSVPPPVPPRLIILPGCYHPDYPPACQEEPNCPPAEWYYDPAGWYIDPTNGCWVNGIYGVTTGCVCIGFDGYLAVELASFVVTPGAQKVTVAWATASESDNDHFEIVRNGEKIAQIATLGNDASGHSYSYTDRSVQSGVTYDYALVAVDVSGNRTTLGTESVSPFDQNGLVTEYSLYQNYPNPFNPSTQIRFDLAEAGFVTLKVFNTMGQEVATLINGQVGAGAKTVSFDAASLPSGVYLYELKAGSFTSVKKMMLMK